MSGGADPRYGADYFEKVYRDYAAQNPKRKLAFYAALVRAAAGNATSPRLLEIGCGPGFFLEAAGAGWDRFGTDVSEWAVGEARRRVPEATIAVAPAEAIPFAGAFRAVAAFDVLEHLENPEAAVASVASKLEPGGALVFVVPVYDGPLGPVVRYLDRDPTHVQKRSRHFWLSLAGRHFSVESWRGVFRYLPPWRRYMHFPTRSLRRFAPAIAVTCRKVS
jgi:SAM-dependent methyltransferase